jgi:hypothetical protein
MPEQGPELALPLEAQMPEQGPELALAPKQRRPEQGPRTRRPSSPRTRFS